MIQAKFSLGQVNYEEMNRLTTISTNLLVGFLILIYVAGNLVICNKDIPICDKRWQELGKETKDWRERCLNGNRELNSLSCKAEKDYFKGRIRMHKKMCFYEGNASTP